MKDEFDQDEFRIGVKTRIYNHTLKSALARKQFTYAQLSELTGIPPYRISNFMRFRQYPRDDELIQLAIALEQGVSALFPEGLRNFKITGPPDDMVIGLEEAQQLRRTEPALIDQGFEDLIINTTGLGADIEGALATLMPRERIILRLRFGLEGEGADGCSYTFDEIGKWMGKTRERVRQIEAKALRKLRHPSRSRYLKEYLDDVPETLDDREKRLLRKYPDYLGWRDSNFVLNTRRCPYCPKVSWLVKRPRKSPMELACPACKEGFRRFGQGGVTRLGKVDWEGPWWPEA